MATPTEFARELIDALDEPALVVEQLRTVAANQSARNLLGRSIERSDVRLAIRHPEAVRLLMTGSSGDLELTGIGGIDRPWALSVRNITADLLLVRLIDRSDTRAAERMRTDFVANASHELRTPLATVIGYAETLAEEGPVPDEMRQRFGTIIDAEARRMLRIVEDLMSLSRIEADRFRIPDTIVSLAEIASIAVEQSAGLADRRGCSVAMTGADESSNIAGDFGQLLQLADNLIANAIRYGCNSANSVVVVAVESVGRQVALTVRDEGDGIAAEHLPRLTERFYRVDSARSRESGGTGLGLAIVKHIVERHRGTIDIRSLPGAGTSVRITFPAQ
jgi:two-component system phosphate regulon sensor histidine kinase PhoR